MRSFVQALLRRASPAVAPAVVRAPEGMRVYAVGDVHGCLAALGDMLDQIRRDVAEATAAGLRAAAVFLGDYVDRGPDSRLVVELLSSDPLPAVETYFLLGNHEAAMLAFLDAPEHGEAWLAYGGMETLLSYGVRIGTAGRSTMTDLRDQLAARLPARHLNFLKSLKSMAVLGDYAFVHAGVVPGVALDAQRTEDLIAVRGEFLAAAGWHGKMIVHGHTIVEEPDFRANRIAIDTGAYGTGVLSCLVMEADRVRVMRTSADARSGFADPSGGRSRSDHHQEIAN